MKSQSIESSKLNSPKRIWLNRIIRYVKAPHRAAPALARYLFTRHVDQKFYRTFDQINALRRQSDMYAAMGLNRDDGIRLYDRFVAEYGDIINSSLSEHSYIFSAISAASQPVNKILEFGTYDGVNCLLLSYLFPNAKITTIDLPDDHAIFANTYNRESADARQLFIATRTKHIEAAGAVLFRQENSILETFSTIGEYDLIWVDGAHGYPVAAVDIVNAIRLLSPCGILMCDDVYTPANESQHTSDNMYRSVASYETLKAFEDEGVISVDLIDKRIDPVNIRPRVRKFVAYCRKLLPAHA